MVLISELQLSGMIKGIRHRVNLAVLVTWAGLITLAILDSAFLGICSQDFCVQDRPKSIWSLKIEKFVLSEAIV